MTNRQLSNSLLHSPKNFPKTPQESMTHLRHELTPPLQSLEGRIPLSDLQEYMTYLRHELSHPVQSLEGRIPLSDLQESMTHLRHELSHSYAAPQGSHALVGPARIYEINTSIPIDN